MREAGLPAASGSMKAGGGSPTVSAVGVSGSRAPTKLNQVPATRKRREKPSASQAGHRRPVARETARAASAVASANATT